MTTHTHGLRPTGEIYDELADQQRHAELVLAQTQLLEQLPGDDPDYQAIIKGDPVVIGRRIESLNALPVERSPGVNFLSPRQLAETGSVEPDWIIHGLLARQAITEIDGKVKAAGKTTLLLFAIRSLLDGQPFLGYATRQTNVVLLSEQQSSPLLSALFRAGLHDRDDGLRILLRSMFAGLSWPQVVERAAEECRATNAGLLVIDTIGKLAGIRNENEAGEWSAAMSPLMDLTQHANLATAIARHDRKGGGEVGESGRGSSQGSGDVDIILALRRPEGNQPTTRRVITSLSRYDETPEKIVIELLADGYVLLGEEEAVVTADARELLMSALGSAFRQVESGASQRDLIDLGASKQPPIKRWAILEALNKLVSEQRVTVTGKARSRKTPLRYWPSGVVVGTPTNGVPTTRLEESEAELLQQLRLGEIS